MSEKRFIITFETVVEAEDLYEAVTIGNELEKKYKEDKLELKGVMVMSMTENKRFTSDIHRIIDNDEEIACADTMDDAEILVDLLNEQEKEIRQLNHLVKIATSIIEWNTVPQIRRAWQNYLNKVGDVE